MLPAAVSVSARVPPYLLCSLPEWMSPGKGVSVPRQASQRRPPSAEYGSAVMFYASHWFTLQEIRQMSADRVDGLGDQVAGHLAGEVLAEGRVEDIP